MKYLLGILTAIMMGCATQATIPTVREPTMPAILPIAITPPTTQLLTSGTHSFRAATTMVLAKTNNKGQDNDTMYIDRAHNTMVIVKTGPISDPLETLVARLMITMANSDFIMGNPEPIIWLNHQAVYFVIERGTLRAYQWISLVDGQGIAFTCGGLTADASRNDVLCHAMADTVMLAPLLPSTGSMSN